MYVLLAGEVDIETDLGVVQVPYGAISENETASALPGT
jgi:hypothetical protein